MTDNKLKDVLNSAFMTLEHFSISRLDAEILLCYVLNKDRTYLISHADEQITPDQLQQFNDLIAARKTGQPVAYLTGKKAFWTHDFVVNEHVLIPRPETELLVELALELGDNNSQPIAFADLGTGSGAIAISIAAERPSWSCTATDKSTASLRVAQHNASRIGTQNIAFIQSDWFTALAKQTFDIIISNPPYIAHDDQNIEDDVAQYEPSHALYAKRNGLSDLFHIVDNAATHLNAKGFLLLEHGFEQAQEVKQRMSDKGFIAIRQKTDLSGHTRVTYGQISRKSCDV